MKWHPEVLSPNALVLAQALGAIPILKNFYLAGGTALALQRGHRISLDFDFFSLKKTLDIPERETLKKVLSTLKGFRIREEKEGTLHALAMGIEITFLHYPYPILRRPSKWNGLQIASLPDIGLMKIGAIIGRGSRRDFRDLREICRIHNLESLLKSAESKFASSEDFLFQAAKALVYFDDAQSQPDPKLLKPEPWANIQLFFQNETIRIFKSLRL
ncbi:MAG: nucleotidyl transferase AbiEii/AbiGii toxin family protein [Elusimicrobia bacterium]|nr:nucleotidyl transferase AbiEii/AbiGii toxin family protein [Elusimicrobiota bacterium]